jgi:pilus assembly protein CpaE
MGLPLTVLVVSDTQLVATKVRTLAVRAGLDCPHSKVVSFETVSDALLDAMPDILFVAMSEQARLEKALSQLRPVVSSTIIAVGTPSSLKEALAAIRAGADDYLNDSEGFGDELEELLQRLHSKRSPHGDSAYTIAIGSAVGGSGGSTVAANLAAEIARRQERCILVDLRAPVSDQPLLLNLEPRHSLVELCQHGLELDEATFSQMLAPHECGIELLSAFGSGSDEWRPSSGLLLRFVQLAQARCSYVVVDLNCTEGEGHLAIAQMSDVIGLILRLDVVALLKTKQTIDHLKHAGIDEEQIVIVANRCGQPNEISIKLAEKSIGRRIDHRLPDDVKTVNASVNVGRPAVLEAPTAKVSKGLKQLCDELLSRSRHRQRTVQAGRLVATSAK